MKKVILCLSILFAVISCSDDENSKTGKDASVKVFFNKKLTNKNIQRGLIPVVVDIINIHTQKGGESLFIDYPFTLVDNGTAGAETEFVLKNLQMGTVNFKVFTNGGFGSGNNFGEGNGGLYYGERAVVAETGTLQSVFDKYSVKKPGIVFAANGTKVMVAGINEPITFDLKASNGRIISIYTLSQALKDMNYTAKIEAIWSGNAILNKSNYVVRYEGTKACSLGNGNIAEETITVFNAIGETVAVFVVKPIIVNGESTNTIYTVTEDNIPTATLITPTIFVPEFKNDAPAQKGA
jgi:hypothetical protein